MNRIYPHCSSQFIETNPIHSTNSKFTYPSPLWTLLACTRLPCLLIICECICFAFLFCAVVWISFDSSPKDSRKDISWREKANWIISWQLLMPGMFFGIYLSLVELLAPNLKSRCLLMTSLANCLVGLDFTQSRCLPTEECRDSIHSVHFRWDRSQTRTPHPFFTLSVSFCTDCELHHPRDSCVLPASFPLIFVRLAHSQNLNLLHTLPPHFWYNAMAPWPFFNRHPSTENMGILTIVLDKVTNLKDEDTLGKSDPYIKVCWLLSCSQVGMNCLVAKSSHTECKSQVGIVCTWLAT